MYELTHKAKCILSRYKGTPDFFHPQTTIHLQIQDEKGTWLWNF